MASLRYFGSEFHCKTRYAEFLSHKSPCNTKRHKPSNRLMVKKAYSFRNNYFLFLFFCWCYFSNPLGRDPMILNQGLNHQARPQIGGTTVNAHISLQKRRRKKITKNPHIKKSFLSTLCLATESTQVFGLLGICLKSKFFGFPHKSFYSHRIIPSKFKKKKKKGCMLNYLNIPLKSWVNFY